MTPLAAACCVFGALLVAVAPMMGLDAARVMAVAHGAWVAGNAIWLLHALRLPRGQRGRRALAAQFGVFLLLALWGLANWRAL